ncbi:hypothetical protein GGX14DRAFT_415757 [Mycena pura]|uniref:C2H2-type domain-containing protein n=1 Tax=Mycena pura TaxID=153505 RepID=A0AAD7E5K5_9AGAR|nr:hypothetical protein GGX14DRAFT_415757 [Mycena pura]
MLDTYPVFTSNISTSASKATASKSTPEPSSRRRCLFDIFSNGTYTPDIDFQSNRLIVSRIASKPVGLGLGCVEPDISQHSFKLRPVAYQKRTGAPNYSRVARKGSSFDCERSMAHMTLDEHTIPATAPPASSLSTNERPATTEESELNSLCDLNMQHPSSLDLNTLSPVLNYSYTPTLSPSWSLESIFIPAALSGNEGLSFSSSGDKRPSPAQLSSSPSLFISNSPLAVKEEPSLQPSPNLALPLADIDSKMYPVSVLEHVYSIGVDPAHITPSQDCPPLPSPDRDVLKPEDAALDSPGFDHNMMKSLNLMASSPQLSPGFSHYDSKGYITSLVLVANPSLEMRKMGDSNLSGNYSPSPVSTRATCQNVGLPPNAMPRAVKRKSSTNDASCRKGPQSFVPGTPILDAHRGITQVDLQCRARRYQQRNPGTGDFDKEWLASFSGKLTVEGEMMTDFRCYIVGCKQTNKRRDHMIVHVGSHLDQRLFKCDKCPSRFTRKNELKRHEQSHDTSRPFACTYCGTAAFRRQDLLSRHIRTKHQQGDKENVRPPKKAKIEEN